MHRLLSYENENDNGYDKHLRSQTDLHSVSKYLMLGHVTFIHNFQMCKSNENNIVDKIGPKCLKCIPFYNQAEILENAPCSSLFFQTDDVRKRYRGIYFLASRFCWEEDTIKQIPKVNTCCKLTKSQTNPVCRFPIENEHNIQYLDIGKMSWIAGSV